MVRSTDEKPLHFFPFQTALRQSTFSPQIVERGLKRSLLRLSFWLVSKKMKVPYFPGISIHSLSVLCMFRHIMGTVDLTGPV